MVAKALALGADAVSIGSAAMIAIGDNDPKWSEEYKKLGSKTGMKEKIQLEFQHKTLS